MGYGLLIMLSYYYFSVAAISSAKLSRPSKKYSFTVSRTTSSNDDLNFSNELEIDATTIYSELTSKNFGEILSPKLSHATN